MDVFNIKVHGSTAGRELRGGFLTFFAMAHIVVLNPIILASGADKFGHHLGVAQFTTATTLIAAIMTALMGLGANLPLAIGAVVVAYVVLRIVNSTFRETHWLLRTFAVLFVVYFCLAPIERLLNVS